MPWSNVPKDKWPKMESCVKDLKAKGKDERAANAICYTSIMGKSITDLELDQMMKGGENMNDIIEKKDVKVEEKPIEEKPVVEETPKVEEVVEKPVETPVETPAPETPVEEKKEEVPAEVVVEEKPVEEKPAEEITKQTEGNTDQPGPSAKGGLDGEMNPKHGEKGHKCGPKCPEYKDESKMKADFADSLKKVEELIATLTQKVDALTEKVTAPAEGATDAKASKVEKVDEPKVEEKPKEKVEPAPEETPKEETPAEPKVEEKKEETPKEEVKKTDTSSEGAVFEKILGLVNELESRLKKVEASPVPSKVVVFSKGEEGATVDDEMTKVENRLVELAKMREADPNFYRSSGYEQEAFNLVKTKKTLQAQAK